MKQDGGSLKILDRAHALECIGTSVHGQQIGYGIRRVLQEWDVHPPYNSDCCCDRTPMNESARSAPPKQPRSATEFILAEFERWILSEGLPAYRARQVFEWIFRHRALHYGEMSSLSKSLRDRLAGSLPIASTEVVHHQNSIDGTIKLLLRLHDGENIETVMIPEEHRRTVCISSQVGCGMGCIFCASGLLGLKRHLSAGEIVEQVLHVQRVLPENERVSHLVFMGMGEPLGNYKNLDRAMQVLQAEWGCGIGARHMTVSTVGLLGQARLLARHHPQVTLAISLHAPNDEIRKQVVPTAKKITIGDLIGGAKEYFDSTGRKITFEYCLMGGMNCEPRHAEELARRLNGLNCYLNVIPLNPVPAIPLRVPSEEEIRTFVAILRSAGIEVAVRRQRGADIDAACGQLRLQKSRAPVPLQAPRDTACSRLKTQD